MNQGLDHGLMNIWWEFEKDPLKTKGCRAQTRRMKLAPQNKICQTLEKL